MRANLDIKNRHFECGRHKIQVDRIMRSYHLPVWVDRPEAADQVQMIQQVKRLEIKGDVLKFKFKSKPTGLGTSQPPEPRVEPSRGSRRGEKPVTPERERSRGRSRRRRQRTKEVSPASRPMAARPGTPKGEKPKDPEFPSRPPPAAPTQGLDVQYFGRKRKAILEREDWAKAGPQYVGDDGVPITFKLYYGQRLQGPTKDSKKVDRAVCEAHFGPTCLPSTAYPRSCGKFGMWSIRFGGKNPRNQKKLQSQLRPQNRRRAGLLRLPPGPSLRKPADQSLKSQGLSLWFSRLLTGQKVVGRESP